MSDFEEILAAAAELVALPDAARAEAWASSALSLWREEDDPAATDLAFAEYLVNDGGAHAFAVALASKDLADPSFGAALSPLLAHPPADPPPWAAAAGTAEATGAWEFVDHGETSVLIAFAHADTTEHSLLADISERGMESVVVGPPAEDFFELLEGEVEVAAVPVRHAAERIQESWRRLLDGGVASEAYVVNHLVAEARIRSILGDQTRALAVVPHVDVVMPAIDPDEKAELDAWATDNLRRALPDLAPVAAQDTALVNRLAQPLHGEGRTRVEREAYAALEWADWLGVAIGLFRAGAGTEVDPGVLIDLINRCPEVTTSIPKADRSRYETVFGVVINFWRDEGLVDPEGRTTALVRAALPHALFTAWAPPSPG